MIKIDKKKLFMIFIITVSMGLVPQQEWGHLP